MTLTSKRDESGAAATEVALLTPLLLLILMLIVQFALWEHATHVAKAAALEGVGSARLEGASVADGERRANVMLDQLGDRLITGTHVTVTRTATVATVSVTGTVQEVVPGMHLPVKATSTAPVEAFR